MAARVKRIDLDRAAGQIHRQMHNAGQDAGREFGEQFARSVQRSTPRVQAAMVGLTEATRKLRDEQSKLSDAMRSGDYDKVVAASNRVTKAYEAQDRATRKVADANRAFETHANTASEGASTLTQNVTRLGGAVAALGKIGAPVGIVGLGGALVEAAGIAASAAQSLWLLPAALSAVGAGFGTLKLATAGFSDALEAIKDPEAFADALHQLSPNAQQAAMSIKTTLMPAIDDLKRQTQDALFSGVGQQLTTLTNQYMPGIQSMTTGIASSFGAMFRGVTDQLMTPETFGAIHEALGNIATAFQNLAPAAAPLTQAFAEITKVGSGFLPELAAAATDAAQAFSEFITAASRSGDLQRWLSEGLETVGLLGEAAWQLAQAFMSLAPVGQAILPDIVRLLEDVNKLMPLIGAAAVVVGPSIGTWVTAADNASRAIGAIGGVFEGVANVAVSHINRIVNALNAVIGPIQGIASLAGINIPSIPTVSPVNITGPGGGGAYLPKGGGSLPPAFGVPAQAPVGPFESLSPADRWLRADAAANPSAGPIAGMPGTYRRRDGSIGFTATPSMQPSRPEPLAGPYASTGGGGSATSNLPTVPHGNRDPLSLLQGYPVNSSLYGAAGSLLDAQQRRAQAESDLNHLLKDNTATQSEIQEKRNALAKAEREQHEAEMRLNEAKAQSTDRFTNQVQDLTSGLESLSAGLDKDLGLSNGLAGLADNLVRFLGALALAPLDALSQRIQAVNGDEGSGLIGIAASQGAFGPQYTAQGRAAAQGGYAVPGYTSPVGYGASGYPGDAALLSMVPRGRYDASGDLSQGLGDCSSAVEDLVNILDGRPTAGRSLSTHNAHDWLQSHGFVPGYQPGAFNVGFDSGHMEAELPQGTRFNWGSDAAAARGGIGGQGAASFPNQYYRPVGASPLGSSPVAPTTASLSPMLSDPALTNNPALTNPALTPPLSGVPSMAGGPLSAGMPQSAPFGSGYSPTQQPQAQQGWQPGSKGGGAGGLIGAAAGAASMGADMFAPGSGAAVQLAMQLARRTIEYGGEVASAGIQGLFDIVSVSDPDGGPGASINDSWLGRLGGSLAGMSFQLPASAGGTDKQTEQGKLQAKAQEGLDAAKSKLNNNGNGPLIGTMNVQADRAQGQKLANELQYASYAAGLPR